ncbi:MAG: hypothetical protein WCF39_21230 [Pseudolabrys sp.]
MVNRLYQHAVFQKEKEDFAHVVSDAEQRLKSADLHVGDDFVQRWFESEAIRDPLLRSAWDNRLRSEHRVQISHTADLPEKLTITFDRGRTLRSCRIVWRNETEAGLEFVRHGVNR